MKAFSKFRGLSLVLLLLTGFGCADDHFAHPQQAFAPNPASEDPKPVALIPSGNLISSPNAFELAPWLSSPTIGIVPDQTQDPSGKFEADLLIETGTSNDYVYFSIPTANLIEGDSFCVGVYVKNVDSTETYLSLWHAPTSATSPQTKVHFDWLTLTAATEYRELGGVHNSGAEDIGEGWYRLWAELTYTSTLGVPELRFELQPSRKGGEAGSIFAWGGYAVDWSSSLTDCR